MKQFAINQTAWTGTAAVKTSVEDVPVTVFFIGNLDPFAIADSAFTIAVKWEDDTFRPVYKGTTPGVHAVKVPYGSEVQVSVAGTTAVDIQVSA